MSIPPEQIPIHYLTTAEAAKRMKVAQSTVRDLCARGILAGAVQDYDNGPWSIPEKSVEEWIEKNQTKPRWIAGWYRLKKHPVIVAIVFIVLALGALGEATGFVQIVGSLRPTPLPVRPATDDETLIIIASFVDPQGSYPQREIRDAIEEEAAKLGLSDLRYEVVPDVLERTDREAAQALGEQYNAAMVIWGEDTAVNIIANFLHLKEPTFTARDVNIEQKKGDFRTTEPRPDPYSSFITDDLPAQLTFLALFAIGHTQYVDKSYAEAVTTIEQAIEVAGSLEAEGLASAYFRLGWLYHGPQKELEKARQNYTRAIEFDPKSAAAYTNRGNVYAEQGDLTAAIADFTQAITLTSKSNALPYYYRGNAYYVKGDLEKAIQNFTKAIEIDPLYASAYNNRGIALSNQGVLEEALQNFNKADELRPEDANIFYNRGLTHHKKGDLATELDDYAEALRLNPEDARVYYNRAFTYIQIGVLDAAVADFRSFLKIAKEHGQYQPLWTQVDDLIKQLEVILAAAIADYDRAIELDLEDAAAYTNHGNAYADQGELTAAIADYSRAIELDPQYIAAYGSRGTAHAENGDLDAAAADFRTFLKIAKESGQHQSLWAQVAVWIEQLEAGENPFE